jgi:hypothetical protein
MHVLNGVNYSLFSVAPFAMKILWDAYHDMMLLLLNFHHVWRSYAPIKDVALNMLLYSLSFCLL